MKSLKQTALLACLSAMALSPARPGDPAARAAAALRDRILAGSRAAEWTARITDYAGPRLAGSPGDRAAVSVALALLRAQGFADVRAEKVVVPVWERGLESGEVVSPVVQKLVLTALGDSVATPESGIEGEIVRAASLAELDALGEKARGRIVFVDRPTARTSDGSGYGDSGTVRSRSASHAARLGAIGVLIRSIGTDSVRRPHTGGLIYEAGAPKIPAAALSSDDAGLLRRLLAAGSPVRVRFTLGCRRLPDAESANVLADVRGREKPEEIVLLAAHLDSWDLGTGALDDAAGCGIVIEAARQIAALSPRPRRTVRVVLFANEENGLKGGEAYAADHSEELPRHVAALEADLGQGPPLGISFNAGPSAEARLKSLAVLLAPIAADRVLAEDLGGADLAYLLPSGIPNLGLLLDATEYFDYHHTADDTFDRIDPRILDRSTAAAATAAYLLAEWPEALERIPPEKRKLPEWLR